MLLLNAQNYANDLNFSPLRSTSLTSLQSLVAVSRKTLKLQLVVKRNKKTHTKTMVEDNFQDDCS